MLNVEVSLTGGQLAPLLARDPEEFWYLLMNLVDAAAYDFPDEVSEHASGLAADKVVEFLNYLARRIENRS